MLDVWSLVTPRVARRVAFFAGSLFVLLPALASGQSTSVTAIWDASPHTDQVSHYEVCVGTSSLSCNIHRVMVSASQTSYAFAPPAGELVHVAVRASNHRGRGSYSTEHKFSIPSFTALTNRRTAANAAITPINLSVTDPDGSRLTFTHTGLPFGVTMNPGTGRITGTPTTAGTYNVTIFVSDGLKTVSRSFVWTVTSGATADRTPPALTITSHASGLVVTTARQRIRGTVTDSGGSGISAVRVNGQSATGGTASASNTTNWSQTITLSSGSNTITVDAVDGAGNIQMQQLTLLLGVSGSSNNTSSSASGSSRSRGTTSGGTSTSSGPLTITPLTSSLASPQSAGTSITFVAGATGGHAPYQFKWLVLQGTTSTVVRSWSSSNTYTWRPTTAGGHRVVVWARDATTTADVGNVNTSVPFRVREGSAPLPVTPPSAPVPSPTQTSGPVTITGLTSNIASPQSAGTSITFFTGATGGRAPYQFKWLVLKGTTWTVVRNWSSSNTYTWRPTTAGGHRVVVWARDATTTADVGNVNTSVPFRVREGSAPPPVARPSAPVSSPTPTSGPLTITGLTSNIASPQRSGASITFTASATGGRGPYQFKWFIFDGVSWTIARDWNSKTTFVWRPTTRAAYRIGIWARDATTKADISTVSWSVPYRIRKAGIGD